jgi:hypothetical protein
MQTLFSINQRLKPLRLPDHDQEHETRSRNLPDFIRRSGLGKSFLAEKLSRNRYRL